MTKRIVTMLLAVVMVLSAVMLVACDTTPKTSDKAVTPSAPASQGENQSSESAPVTPSVGGDVQPSTPTPTPTPVPSTPTPTPTPVDPEPDYGEKGTQEWIKWLAEVDQYNDENPVYNRYLGGGVYSVRFKEADGTELDASPWECWPAEGDVHLHMCYQLDRTEIDASANVNNPDEYAYSWQIWYRDAEEGGDFEVIETAPWSVYVWGGDNNNIIYRIPTYDEGMKDMALADGETSHEYEIVIVIYEGEIAKENIHGYRGDWITYSNSTEAYIAKAKENGWIAG